MPIPKAPIVQPTYGTATGTSRRPIATIALPVPIGAPPIAVMTRAPHRPITLDCHHEPAAHAIEAVVSTMPATPMESPRVSVSISVTKPSVAKNATDARNAAADAAGIPARAVSVPVV